MLIIYRAGVANSEHIEESGQKVLDSKDSGNHCVFYFPTLKDKVLLRKENIRLSVTIYAIKPQRTVSEMATEKTVEYLHELRVVSRLPTMRLAPWLLVLETQGLHLPSPPTFQGTLNVYGKSLYETVLVIMSA